MLINQEKAKKIFIFILIAYLFVLLFITRFINLNWGLPYAMHPDESNMAVAIMRLDCPNILDLQSCLNPKFYAYGQLPLYLSYFAIQLINLISGTNQISGVVATMSLRILSAILGVLLAILIFFLVKWLSPRRALSIASYSLIALAVVFSPGLIQWAHFGTTETLLMFLYTFLIVASVLFLKQRLEHFRYIVVAGLLLGLSVGTKLSGLSFAFIPLFALVLYQTTDYKKFLLRRLVNISMSMLAIMFVAFLVASVASPHNLISWRQTYGTWEYESKIGIGEILPFYTRSFFMTVPIIFQFTKIFPFVLGWPVFILFIVSFVALPFNKQNIFLRLVFLSYFLPFAFLYSKWTRFIAPIVPLMLVMALMMAIRILDISKKYFLLYRRARMLFIFILIFILSLPGIAFLSVYTSEDVRFKASNWIIKNIPSGSRIISETANSVDLPVSVPGNDQFIPHYHFLSANLYEIDQNQQLNSMIMEQLAAADYVIIPSRRVIANHTCYLDGSPSDARCQALADKYPNVHAYYKEVFENFRLIKTFAVYPKIELFGFNIWQFPDEFAEETWSVFDHPVIRIYARSS